MKKYTLYTEDKGNLGELAGRYFEGFTLVPAIGFWKGKDEKSVKIEVFVEDHADDVYFLADDIKVKNKQEAVLIEMPNGEGKFV